MDDLVSIIVPIYNVEQYLDRCITSLVNQSYQNIEIILVNDGSTDNSLTICQKYSNDARVFIYNKKNSGVSDTRNYGVKKARGKYVLFVDSDDWIELDMCEKMLEVAHDKDLDIVFCSYIKSYSDKEVCKYIIASEKEIIYYDEKDTKDKVLRRIIGLYGNDLAHPEHMDSLVTVWGKLYKKEIIKDIAFVDTKMIGNEDALYNIAAFNNAQKTAYMNECYYHYWKANQGSLTKNTEFTHYYKWKKLFSYIEQYLVQNDIYDRYKESFHNRMALSVIGLGLSAMKMNASYLKKVNNLGIILNDEQIHESLVVLKKEFFDFKWKLFFYLAQHKKKYMISLLFSIILNVIK